MAENARKLRKKELRRERVSKRRQDTFAIEYIRVKYSDIYHEGMEFYHAINKNNPGKFDLRKTDDYKLWKANLQRKKEPSTLEPSNPEPSTLEPSTLEPSTLEPATLEPSTLEPSTLEPATLEPSTLEPATLEPSTPEPSTPEPSTLEPSTPEPATPEPSTPEPSTSKPVTTEKHTWQDNLQLRIPLIDKDIFKHPIETLQTVTEEILEEGTIYPSLEDEIAPELINKILEELRQEPDLHAIFTDVEQQLEFEQLGMDIDIGEDYGLENELALW